MIDYANVMKKEALRPGYSVPAIKGPYAELHEALGDPIKGKQKLNQIRMRNNPRPNQNPKKIGSAG